MTTPPTPEELERMGITDDPAPQSTTPEQLVALVQSAHLTKQVENSRNGVHAAVHEKALELAKFREEDEEE